MGLRDLILDANSEIRVNEELVDVYSNAQSRARLQTPLIRTSGDPETDLIRNYRSATHALLLFPDVTGSDILTVVDTDATDRIVIAAGNVFTVDGSAGDDRVILRNNALLVSNE